MTKFKIRVRETHKAYYAGRHGPEPAFGAEVKWPFANDFALVGVSPTREQSFAKAMNFIEAVLRLKRKLKQSQE